MNSLGPRLWCVLGGLYLAACNGGPISDFPRGSSDKDDLGAGAGGDGTSNGDDSSDNSGADAGTAGPSTPDDGWPDDGAGADGDSAGPPGEDGADAGQAPPLDGGADGGVGPDSACTAASDGSPDACHGLYCSTTFEQLTAGSVPGGACSDAPELALVCDGAISRVVAACMQEHVLAADAPAAVAGCVRSDAALAQAGDDCLVCHVEETLCALESCLAPCLSALSAECETCRAMACGDTFYACSGLLRP